MIRLPTADFQTPPRSENLSIILRKGISFCFRCADRLRGGGELASSPFPGVSNLNYLSCHRVNLAKVILLNVAFFSDFFQVVRYHMSLVETAEIVFHATPELTSCVPRTGEALLLSVEEF